MSWEYLVKQASIDAEHDSSMVKSVMVTIPMDEYLQLKKAARYLNLIRVWSSAADDSGPIIFECRHPGCHAVELNTFDRIGNGDCDGCESMTSCDQCDACLIDGYGAQYCDKHVKEHLTEAGENSKSGQILWSCNECKVAQHEKDQTEIPLYEKQPNDGKRPNNEKGEKVNDIPSKDITLVMEHGKCSREEALEALIKHDGDIVVSIIAIQSK